MSGVPAPAGRLPERADRATPVIPSALRRLRARGYRNIFELTDTGRLYGTETMAGDWQGRLLLLSKDFAPSALIERRLRAGERDVWYHQPDWPTNRAVAGRLAANGVRLDDPRRAGVLFGSVCWLLRADGRTSGPLPAGWQRPAREVLAFTLAAMPRLEAVACLGRDSFDFVTGFLGVRADWRRQRDLRRPVEARGLAIHALSHPGNLGTLSRLPGAAWAEKQAAVAADWRALGQAPWRRD